MLRFVFAHAGFDTSDDLPMAEMQNVIKIVHKKKTSDKHLLGDVAYAFWAL